MKSKRPVQLAIDFSTDVSDPCVMPAGPTWGGKRKGAGRKPASGREGFVPRVRRPRLDWKHPTHVTLRTVPNGPPLRTQRVLQIVHRLIPRVSWRGGGFRVNHFSVQGNHLHLIVEADHERRLQRGVQWLGAQIARAVNKLVGRRGSLWRDRYHRRDLTSARQVRNTITYVLMNVRKHSREWRVPAPSGAPPLDMCSSALWLDGWDSRAGPHLERLRAWFSEKGLTTCPVAPPETWFGRAGWKRHGLIRPTELPASSPP